MRPTGKYVGLWPGGLLRRVFELCGEPKTLLEPFSSLSKLGVSVDLNPNVKPHVRADAQLLPFKNNCFDMVLMDPPYSKEAAEGYAKLWTARKLKFGIYKALREAARVTRKGGFLSFCIR